MGVLDRLLRDAARDGASKGPPASRATPVQQAAPSPEALRNQEFLAKSSSLPAPEDGATRLFRVGEIATNYQPPKTVKMWGQQIPYTQWQALTKEARESGTNPSGAAGRWATDAADQLDFYIRDNPLDAPVYYFDVPNASQYNVSRTPYLKNSRNETREFILPDDQLKAGKRLMSLATLLLAPAASQDE
jgi:hypothetical protein